MNANYKTWVPRLSMNVLLLAGALSGCTQDNPQAPVERTNAGAPSEPLVLAPSSEQVVTEQPQQKFEVKADDWTSVYVPEFQREQLIGITEQRTSPRATMQARYEFQGARLLRYSGGAFEAEGEMHAEFNLKGSVIAATVDSQPASQQEIARLRAHAQLLRSHALAQQATRTHSFSSR